VAIDAEERLTRARAALARGNLAAAEQEAAAVLREPVAPAVRSRALLVAGEAAYQATAYPRAGSYYSEIVARHYDRPEAPRAAFALAWTDVRIGHSERARRTWTRFADSFPADERAPLALLLAAELARQAGDTAASQRLLDRALGKYPASPYAGPARLTRGMVALQRQREDEALRDVDTLVRTTGPWVVTARERLEAALEPAGREAGLEVGAPASARPPAAGDDALGPFAKLFAGGGRRERTPYVLHGLTLVSGADRGWADVTTAELAGRLVEHFAGYAPAGRLLDRVAATAAKTGQWPIARRAYATLLARAPASAGGGARLAYAEALQRTGADAEARTRLEEVAAGGGAEAPRALRLLVEIHDRRGEQRAALDTMRRLVNASQGESAAEAAYRLAERLRADAQHAAAAEWYMTAVYLGERTRWARLSLLGAGRSFTALGEKREALNAYWRLVARRPNYDPAADAATSGEAAYLAAQILHEGGLPDEAVKMYAMSAQLTAGSAAEPRALLGALRCFVALGEARAAERTFERLSSVAKADPAVLAEARKALGAHAAESALPTTVH
jgi:tetratricopeptide (TPR) repeat protein